MSNGPDLEGLLEFSQETARRSGRFFVGRKAEIERIAVAVNGWRVAVGNDDSPDGVILVTGAPGVGKTALLRHLLRDPPTGAAALLLPRECLNSPSLLACEVQEALTGGGGRAAQRLLPSGVSVNLGAARFSWNRAEPPASLADLGKGIQSESDGRLVMLLIDEVQNATPEQVRTIETLHVNAMKSVALAPVLAGLSDSDAVLLAGGVSRLAPEGNVRLGRLNSGEPAVAVRLMLDRFRIRGPEALGVDWGEAIEAASDCWPQHLKTGMTALARELVRTEGRLDRADRSRVLQDADALREKADHARRSPAMVRARPLLAEFLKSIPLPVLDDLAEDALRSLMDAKPIPGVTPRAFLDHLVHQGVLHDPDGEGRYVCPIPSFRDFLIRQGGTPAR